VDTQRGFEGQRGKTVTKLRPGDCEVFWQRCQGKERGGRRNSPPKIKVIRKDDLIIETIRSLNTIGYSRGKKRGFSNY